MNKIPLYQEVKSLKFLYISKSGSPAEKVDSKTFKKDFINKMNSYVGDDEILFKKIKDKDYTVQNIYQIVEEYNSWFASKIRNQ